MPPEPRVPGRALAVYAHPDDPDVACAGTLAAWAAAGAEITVISVASGEKGAADGGLSPVEVAAVRSAESREASAVLGVTTWETFGVGDGEVDNDPELRARLVARIRALRPDVVLTSDPTAVFFGTGYVNHHDHRELGWAVLDAVSPAAGNPRYFPAEGAAHRVGEVLLSGTLEPDWWIDITETLPAKIEALRCHRSQMGPGTELGADAELIAAVVTDRAAAEGRRSGLRFAEGYRRLRLS